MHISRAYPSQDMHLPNLTTFVDTVGSKNKGTLVIEWMSIVVAAGWCMHLSTNTKLIFKENPNELITENQCENHITADA